MVVITLHVLPRGQREPQRVERLLAGAGGQLGKSLAPTTGHLVHVQFDPESDVGACRDRVYDALETTDPHWEEVIALA